MMQEAVYQGVPVGNFVYPYIEILDHPDGKIPVGEEIRLRANFRVSCPGQPFYSPAWTVGIKAVGDGIAAKYDWTYYTGGEVVDQLYLLTPSYPIMPDRPVTLDVTLWGNPGAFQDLPMSGQMGEWVLLDAMTISLDPSGEDPTPPGYRFIAHHEYEAGKTYAGKADKCTASFRVWLPEWIPGQTWVRQQMINAIQDEIAAEGGEVLCMKVYEDATPTLWTDYKVEVIAAVHHSPAFPWALVIGLILGIVLVVAITNLVVQFKEIDWSKAGGAMLKWGLVGGGVALAVIGLLAVGAGKKKEKEERAA